jgi:hypothetical protein
MARVQALLGGTGLPEALLTCKVGAYQQKLVLLSCRRLGVVELLNKAEHVLN